MVRGNKQSCYAVTIRPGHGDVAGWDDEATTTLEKWLQKNCNQWSFFDEKEGIERHVHGRFLLKVAQGMHIDPVVRSLRNHFGNFHKDWNLKVAIKVKYLYDHWDYIKKDGGEALLHQITSENAWVYAKEEDKKPIKYKETNQYLKDIMEMLLPSQLMEEDPERYNDVLHNYLDHPELLYRDYVNLMHQDKIVYCFDDRKNAQFLRKLVDRLRFENSFEDEMDVPKVVLDYLNN